MVEKVREHIPSHKKELDEVSSYISTSDVETTGEVGKGEAVKDRYNVSNTVARVDDDASCET